MSGPAGDSGVGSANREPWAQELALLQRLQNAFVGTRCLELDDLVACGRCDPCHAAGGDYYDFLQLADGTFRVVIADVMGKGIGAAMLMTMFRGAVRAASQDPLTPGNLLKRLNDLFFADLQTVGSFITAACVDFGPDRNHATFASGGHPYPLVLRRGLLVPEPIRVRGVSLGMMPDQHYAEQRVELVPGDQIFLYTDGFLETKNRERRPIGMEERQSVFFGAFEKGYPEMLNAIMEGLSRHRNGNPASDDVTIVAVRLGGDSTQ